MTSIKIKKSSKNSKKSFIKFNNKIYRGFKLSELPNKFAHLQNEYPINSWFNYKGLTFISEDCFQSMFGKVDVLK